MLTILLTNDDGYFSEGINALKDALKTIGRVFVVAPDRNMSGCSHSMSFCNPPELKRVSEDTWAGVRATPADCVHLGFHLVLKGVRPNLVVSGINEGPNLAEDVTYSGTVGGAMEGCLLGIPSIAFSAFDPESFNYSEGAQIALSVVEFVAEFGLPKDCYLNVNIPNLPIEEIKGFALTYQGRRFSQKVHDDLVSDYMAVLEGYVSITPLGLDFTNYGALKYLGREWGKNSREARFSNFKIWGH